MTYRLSELNPAKIFLQLDKRDIEISLVTLSLEVEFEKAFGSLGRIFEKVREDSDNIFLAVWILVKDKSFFNNSIENFKEVLTRQKNLQGEELADVINQSISLSVPLIKNMKRYKEMQEMNPASTSGGPCYAAYYDTLAKRYGYSLEQFYSLTLRQLHLLLKTIGDMAYQELEVKASLAGKQLKPRMEYIDITEEEEAENNDHAQDALKRLQEQYKNGQR